MDENQQNPAQPTNSQASTGTAGDSAAQSNDQNYEQLKAELETAQSKLQDMVQISQRALADLQNFRRRSEEEKAGFVTYANADLILALMPGLNSVNLALKHEPKDAEWAKGVEQSLKQLFDSLDKRGLKAIPAVGEKFDPRLHEALLTAPGEKDMVLEELEKGYMLGDKVLKPARVKVGNGEATTPAA